MQHQRTVLTMLTRCSSISYWRMPAPRMTTVPAMNLVELMMVMSRWMGMEMGSGAAAKAFRSGSDSRIPPPRLMCPAA